MKFWRDEISMFFSYGAAPADLKKAVGLIDDGIVNVRKIKQHTARLLRCCNELEHRALPLSDQAFRLGEHHVGASLQGDPAPVLLAPKSPNDFSKDRRLSTPWMAN